MAHTALRSTLAEVCARRQETGLLRTITLGNEVDFCSNDYLGAARDPLLQAEVEKEMTEYRAHQDAKPLGSTGSRLLSGNSTYYEELEEFAADFHGGESALIFNSGFVANLGIFGAIPQKGDIVVYDELCHNSIREGLRLSRGTSRMFAHNDVADMRRVMSEVNASANHLIVAVESVYSMDGHLAPLREICDAAEEFGASVFVDEAHGTGVFGNHGRGLVNEMHCFGKSLGAIGAVVVAPSVVKSYLLNYARPLVYTTALPAHTLATVKCAYAMMQREGNERQQHLQKLILLFHKRLTELPPECSLQSPAPIQGILVPGNKLVVKVASQLQEHGFDVKPIRSPTVPEGTERLRIILHFHNTEAEVNRLMDEVALIMNAPENVAAVKASPAAVAFSKM